MTVLSGAIQAFEASSHAFDTLQIPQDDLPEPTHSIWRYWPVALASAPCIISTITAIATAILDNLGLALLQALAAVAAGGTAIYLYYVGPMQTLEEYVNAFGKRVTALSQGAERLNSTNRDLETINQTFRTRLTQEQERLYKAQADHKKVLRELNGITHKLDKSLEKAKILQESLDKATTILHQAQDETTHLTNLSSSLTKATGKIKNHAQAIEDLHNQAEKCHQKIETQLSELKRHNKTAENIIARFNKLHNRTDSFLKQERKQQLEFEQTLKRFERAGDRLEERVADVQSALSSIEEERSKARETLDQLAQLKQALEQKG